jgi:hypothetical protein
LLFNHTNIAAASGNREQTATTTGIELNQVEKHGTKVCLFSRETQIK